MATAIGETARGVAVRFVQENSDIRHERMAREAKKVGAPTRAGRQVNNK